MAIVISKAKLKVLEQVKAENERREAGEKCDICGKITHSGRSRYDELGRKEYCVCPYCLAWSNEKAAKQARLDAGWRV